MNNMLIKRKLKMRDVDVINLIKVLDYILSRLTYFDFFADAFSIAKYKIF